MLKSRLLITAAICVVFAFSNMPAQKDSSEFINRKILGMGRLYTMAPNPDFTKIASAGGSGCIYI